MHRTETTTEGKLNLLRKSLSEDGYHLFLKYKLEQIASDRLTTIYNLHIPYAYIHVYCVKAHWIL